MSATPAANRGGHYDQAEDVPLDGVVPPGWRDAVLDEHRRVQFVAYELYVLGALRDAIRRREVRVVGRAAGAIPTGKSDSCTS